jgi:hypothetical protein
MPIGVTVTSSSPLSTGIVPTNAGTAFIVGLADRGPTTAKLCASFAQFVSSFGPRTTGSSVLYDSVETFFREGPNGAVCWVARVSDNTAAAATGTLNDGLPAPKPTVLVTALTPGLDGNNTYVEVTNQSTTTFTGNTATNTTLSNISSFTNLAAGVKVTGAGISAGTYIVSVNTGAGTAVLSQATTATATGVTITPYKFTVKIEDSSGNVLETHGPYQTTAQLFADATSLLVVFSQSAGSGFTTNQPATAAAAALTGGADASDITDTSYVTTLTAFGPELGPGQVLAPGRTTSAVWTGLLAHAAANNRHALLDIADQTTAAATVSQAATLPTAANATYGSAYAPQCTIPGTGTTPTVSRTVPASAVAAALWAQVHATGNDNQMPAGVGWPLSFVTGFTENTNANGGWSQTDLNTLVVGGVNGFTVQFGVPCLYGDRTPVPPTTDAIFWSAAASRERMALVADCQRAGEPFVFKPIDGKGVLVAKLVGDLQGVIQNHWLTNALYGATAVDAGSVDPTGNTLASEQAGNLIATLRVRISPPAESVQLALIEVPISQTVA